MEYACYICRRNVSDTVNGLGNHFKRIHNLALTSSSASTNKFVCAQGQCTETYVIFKSFKRHLLKQHPDPQEALSENDAPVDENDAPVDENDAPVDENDAPVDENDAPVDENDAPVDENDAPVDENIDVRLALLKEKIAKEVLAFQAKSNVTFTVTDAAVKLCSSVAKLITDTVKVEVLQFLENENIDVAGARCCELMQKFDIISSPFEEIDKKHKQVAYYKKNFDFIEPREVYLGRREEQIFHHASNRYITSFKSDTFQYIPIIDTLSVILKNPKVFKHIQNKEVVPFGHITSYATANQYKTHPFFIRFPDAIQIQLYYDEVEVCNPLGSKTKIHEVATFYFSILNIPSKYNSSLANIHLLAMCNSQDLKKYCFSSILQPFMNDLRVLESDEGVNININTTQYTLRATIACVCADGLAAHALFGFLSPSAKYFCRLCLAKREDIQDEFRIDKFQKREKNTYEKDVQDSEVNSDASRNSGVKERCVLNSSKYYHCIDNFCFDAMHDLLEGICCMEIKLVLNHWMYVDPVNGFNIDTFNKRLQSFKYGLSDRKNKPSPNFTKQMITNIKDHKIKQKAAQTWCLVRVLPFIVNGFISSTDPHFHLIHLLSRIMQIIFSPVISKGLACYLESLIIQHHEEFKEIFPDVNFINKHHHLLHYPDCLVNFGPLLKMWCMRYEAKHNFFKRRASVNCNYKNITKSLAVSHQLAHCSMWSVNDPFSTNIGESEETVWVASCASYEYLKVLGYEDNCVIKVPKTVTLQGSEYRKGIFAIFMTGSNSAESLPLFCEIQEIVVLPGDNVHFLVKLWTTTHFDPFLNSYSIKWFEHCELRFIQAEILPDYHIYSPWTPFGSNEKYISLRTIHL